MSTSSKDRKQDNMLSCKVYIGGLGSGADSKEIESAFAHFGRVQSVWVARNPPGFAFVAFEDPRDADDAVRCLDGTKLNGKRVRVEKSSGESRWEKWNLTPPVSSSFHGVTLDYKDIREAILIRKQLKPSRSLGDRRSSSCSDHLSSSGSSQSTHRRRLRLNDSSSCSSSEMLRLTEHSRRREKFMRERSSLDRSRSRSSRRTKPERYPRRKTRRGRTRTRRHRHSRGSHNASSSRSSSTRMRSSSDRDRPWRRPRSRSHSSTLKKTDDGTKNTSLLVQNRNLCESLHGYRNKCESEKTEVKPEMVNAQTQTDAISRQTIGIQCRRVTEPRRPAIKLEIKTTNLGRLAKPTSHAAKDDNTGGKLDTSPSFAPLYEDGTVTS